MPKIYIWVSRSCRTDVWGAWVRLGLDERDLFAAAGHQLDQRGGAGRTAVEGLKRAVPAVLGPEELPEAADVNRA